MKILPILLAPLLVAMFLLGDEPVTRREQIIIEAQRLKDEADRHIRQLDKQIERLEKRIKREKKSLEVWI